MKNTNLNEVKDWTSDELFELANSYWKSCAFQTGVKLDIFTTIGKEQLTSQEIANNLNLDEKATDMLLVALTSLKLLRKKEGKYANTPSSEKLLSRNSDHYAGYMALHHHNIITSWTSLSEAIKNGKPVDAKKEESQDGQESWWQVCIQGMISLSLDYAAYVAKELDLSDCHKMLDLGGGPGIYSINFCLNNPQLKATLFDLPSTKNIAEEKIEKFNVEKQVSFKGGNYRFDEFDQEYDLVWMSHIVHSEGPEFCEKLIRKAVKALKPGGKIMIHDYFLNDNMDGPVHSALFALNMLLLTCDGQSYSKKQVSDMLTRTGIKELEFLEVRGQLQSGIITGTV